MNKSLKIGAEYNYGTLAAIRDTASPSQLIDIFITNDWPASITSHSSLALPEQENPGSPPLDEIIRKIKPRYHFAAGAMPSPKFWEREPFTWDGEPRRISRFISLGTFGGEEHTGQKQRVRRPTCNDICNDSYPPSGFTRFPSCHQEAQHNYQVISQRTHLSNPLLIYPNEFMTVPKGKISSLEISTILRSVLGQVCLHFITGFLSLSLPAEAPIGQTSKPPAGYKCRRCQSAEVSLYST